MKTDRRAVNATVRLPRPREVSAGTAADAARVRRADGKAPKTTPTPPRGRRRRRGETRRCGPRAVDRRPPRPAARRRRRRRRRRGARRRGARDAERPKVAIGFGVEERGEICRILIFEAVGTVSFYPWTPPLAWSSTLWSGAPPLRIEGVRSSTPTAALTVRTKRRERRSRKKDSLPKFF